MDCTAKIFAVVGFLKRKEVTNLKTFYEKYKKKIFEILLMLVALFAVSVVSLLVLRMYGIVYYDDGLQLNSELFDSFKASWYGWATVILFQVGVTSLLCFIPGASMAFIMLLQALFVKPWLSFFLAFIGVMLSSLMMYLIGRFGGYKIAKKILGEKECENASELLNHKGVIFFPLMMLFPIFPDDALVMIAGTLKMSLKWFIPSIVIGRGIGIASIVFGLGSIPFEKFTSVWHWVIFILVCAALIAAVFYAAYRFNRYLQRKEEKKTETEVDKE